MKLSFITALFGLLGLTLISSGSLFIHAGIYLFIVATILGLIGYWMADKEHVVAKIKSRFDRYRPRSNRNQQYNRSV